MYCNLQTDGTVNTHYYPVPVVLDYVARDNRRNNDTQQRYGVNSNIPTLLPIIFPQIVVPVRSFVFPDSNVRRPVDCLSMLQNRGIRARMTLCGKKTYTSLVAPCPTHTQSSGRRFSGILSSMC